MTHGTSEQMQWSLAGWFVLVLVSFFIVCAGVDSSGRKAWNHFGNVPLGVSQLSGDSYILAKGVGPADICKDAVPDVIKTSTPLPKLDAQYVQCSTDQTWGDHRGASRNYLAAIQSTATSLVWWLAVAAVFLLINIWWIPASISETRHSRRKAKDEAARNKADAETRRKELARAYAAGEIDDVQFDSGLDHVYKILKKS